MASRKLLEERLDALFATLGELLPLEDCWVEPQGEEGRRSLVAASAGGDEVEVRVRADDQRPIVEVIRWPVRGRSLRLSSHRDVQDAVRTATELVRQ